MDSDPDSDSESEEPRPSGRSFTLKLPSKQNGATPAGPMRTPSSPSPNLASRLSIVSGYSCTPMAWGVKGSTLLSESRSSDFSGLERVARLTSFGRARAASDIGDEPASRARSPAASACSASGASQACKTGLSGPGCSNDNSSADDESGTCSSGAGSHGSRSEASGGLSEP